MRGRILLSLMLFSLLWPLGSPAQNPPVHPVLFLGGYTSGPPTDFAPLQLGVTANLGTYYPNRDTYWVRWNGTAVQFAKALPPSPPGPTAGWTIPTDWTATPPNSARFFALDYNNLIDSTDSDSACNNVDISILNKAYEVKVAVAAIRSVTGVSDVTLVGHSMGGLVARAYVQGLAVKPWKDIFGRWVYLQYNPLVNPYSNIQNSDIQSYAGDVAGIITVDTPHQTFPSASTVVASFLRCPLQDDIDSHELSGFGNVLPTLNAPAPTYGTNTLTGTTFTAQTISSSIYTVAIVSSLPNGECLTDADGVVNLSQQSIINNVAWPTCNSQSCSVADAANQVDSSVITTLGLSCISIPPNPLHAIKNVGDVYQTQYIAGYFLQYIDQWKPIVTGSTATISPASVTFNTIAANTTSQKTVTISNPGPAVLTLSFGSLSAPFSQTNSCSGSIQPSSSCTVTLTFAPTTVGTFSGSLAIHDSTANKDYSVPLSGSAVSGGALLSLSQYSLNFGDVLVNNNVTQIVTLTANQDVSNLSLSPTGSSFFSVSSTTCPTATTRFLAQGSSCTVTEKFLPLSTGTFSGGLTISYTGTGSPISVPMRGNGVTGGGTGGFPSGCTVTPIALNQSVMGTLTSACKDSRGDNFLATDYTFTLSQPTSVTITASASFKVELRLWYGPVSNGIFDGSSSGTLTPSNVPLPAGTYYIEAEPYFSTQTSGTITVTLNGPPPTATPSPTSLSFGNQNVFTASAAKSVTISNTGSQTLSNIVIATTGDFGQTSNCGSALAAASSCTVQVVFSPTVVGGATGTLTLTDNAADSPQSIPLSGTGIGVPAAVLSPTSLTFPSQFLHTTSASQPVLLSNPGTAALSITSIIANGDFSQTNNCGTSVAVGANCTIQVSFAPAAVGTRTGTLSVSDNATGSPHAASLTGTGAQSPPSVSSFDATNVTSNSFTANGTVNPNGATTNAWFEYGTSPTLATFTSTALQPLGSGVSISTTAQLVTGGIAGTTYYYRAAASNSGGTTRGTIIAVTLPTPLAPQSLSPSSGTGALQTFAFSFSDASGYTDITTTQQQFSAGGAGGYVSNCSTAYDRTNNQLYLQNDSGSGWLGPVTVGSGGSLANSQCTIDPGASSASGSGTALTLNLAVRFSNTFATSTNVFGWVQNAAAQNSGWVQLGTWNTTTTLNAGQMSPTAGTGSSLTFSFNYSDPSGYTDITTTQAQFSGGGAGSYVGNCSTAYDRVNNQLYLQNDTGSGWQGPVNVGSAGTLSNSQCTIDLGGSSASGSGTILTVNLAVTFSGTFTGTKTAYGWVQNGSAQNSGWQQAGTWTSTAVLAAPQVSPSSGSGAAQTFTFTYTDPSGYTDITTTQAIFGVQAGAYVNDCATAYDRVHNQLYLQNDAGAGWLGPATVGTAGTLSNTQCTIDLGASSASGSGNILKVSLAVTFSGSFTGSKSVFSWVQNASSQTAGWNQLGSWSTATILTATKVTPNSGSATTQTFAFQYTDPSGYADITTTQAMFGFVATSYVGVCATAYLPQSNQLYLQNDAGAGWLGPMTLGTSNTLSNSQCTISGTGSSATRSGTTLTLNLAVTFGAGLNPSAWQSTASKSIFGWVQNAASQNSGWKQLGSWTH